MKRHIASSAVLAAGVAFLVGCGDENTTEITQVVGMQVVEAGESMPNCTVDNEGAMVYSVDSAEAFYCVSRKWVSMKGEKGEDGKKGADGKSGSAGADGKDGKDGKDGAAGANGKDGSSCTAKALKNGKGYKIVCGGDSVGVVLNGEKGDPGVKGDSGVAGTSCSAEEVSDGVEITCTDGKTFTLSNGADGKDGKSYVDGWMVDSRDRQLYRVVTIGEQTWMAHNLNYETDAGSYCYNDSVKYCKKYGRLYTWATAVGKSEDECGYGVQCNLGDGKVRGVCPEGWHLPDTTEWNALFDAVGGKAKAGKILKSTEGWIYNGDCTDPYFFSALPAGSRNYGGSFYGEGDEAFFWSSTENSSSEAYLMYLNYLNNFAFHNYKYEGLSVRCLKD